MDPQGSSYTNCNTAVCKYRGCITACTQVGIRSMGASVQLQARGGRAWQTALVCVYDTSWPQRHCPKPAERLEEMMTGKEIAYGCTAFRGWGAPLFIESLDEEGKAWQLCILRACLDSELNNGKRNTGLQSLLMCPPTMEMEVPSRVNLNVLVSDGGVKTQVQIVIYWGLKHSFELNTQNLIKV